MAENAPINQGTSRSWLGPLWLQVLIGAVLGIAVGILWPHVAAQTAFLSAGFIKLIRMLLAPVIFLTVAVGIARMGNLREVGRVGIKAIIYFEVLSTISLLIGVLTAQIVKPGVGMHVDPHSLNASLVAGYAHSAHNLTFESFLLNLIPSSITQAFAQNQMLQVILFAVLFGVALAQLRERVQKMVDVLDELMTSLFSIVRIVMYLAPLAAFGGMAFTIGKYGLGSVISLGEFVACAYGASAVFVFVVLGLVARLAGLRLLPLLRYLREELLIVFSTSASEAVLPQVM
ncbi:MAG TPA: cation:dicarboxylase symporter family transporter, partial [Acetobacteraceae bacterium]|nr:cation:dicarboxylase symporter family transporter [Acetobacteraceae bacterium]